LTVRDEPSVVHVLHPGDVALALAGERLETLLGSCVAIVLTDPRRTLGAMCHIVHSSPPPDRAAHDTSYAIPALAAMFERLRRRNIDPRFCEAFVFGGGNMFPALFKHAHVGSGNERWAFDVLAEHGIAVVAHDTGGSAYRRLRWTVGSGDPRAESVEVREPR
jgi:chemotaxis protein CheD